MQYRQFGRTDWEVSILGFGIMRMPVKEVPSEKEPEKMVKRIDRELAIPMVRHAIDAGVNYIDAAYGYHGGECEYFVKEALKDGYREKVKIASKLPSWLIKSADDFDKYFNEQLERLGVDSIDLYLLHALKRDWWENMRDWGVLKWAEDKMGEGKIGHLGFSFHDTYDVFAEIVDAYDWTFCQIMYNYMDIDFQAGNKGLCYAADKGMAVVVMEPLRGGQLTLPPPAKVAEIWDEAPVKRSQADWALQWLWGHPEVSVVLSGMSTMAQVNENLACAENAQVGIFTPEELALVDRVRRAYEVRSPIPCTDCKYCLPCPSGVGIPEVFRLYNSVFMYDDTERPCFSYGWMEKGKRADQCTACKECEERCPQGIAISEWMVTAHEMLGKKG